MSTHSLNQNQRSRVDRFEDLLRELAQAVVQLPETAS